MKIFLLIHILIIGSVPLIKANMQESILMKHRCKIIDHGYFTFCTINDNETINRITFIYSLNLKKQTFAVGFVKSDTISINAISKNELKEFRESDSWNKKLKGTSVEKYFLLFHPDFLKWNNSQKLDFFMRACKKECNQKY